MIKKRKELIRKGLIPTGTSSNRAEVLANQNIARSEAQELEQEAREDVEAQNDQGDNFTSATTINTAEDEETAKQFTNTHIPPKK